MLPLFDLLNHAPGTRIEWAHDSGGEGFRTLAADGVPRGAAVCNNYGPKGNEELMIQYGFALPENPHDVHALVLVLQQGARGQRATETFYIRRADPRWPQFPPDLWSALGRAGGYAAVTADSTGGASGASGGVDNGAGGAAAAGAGVDAGADTGAAADATADADADADAEQCEVGAEEVALLRSELQRRLEPLTATADRDDAIARGEVVRIVVSIDRRNLRRVSRSGDTGSTDCQ